VRLSQYPIASLPPDTLSHRASEHGSLRLLLLLPYLALSRPALTDPQKSVTTFASRLLACGPDGTLDARLLVRILRRRARSGRGAISRVGFMYRLVVEGDGVVYSGNGCRLFWGRRHHRSLLVERAVDSSREYNKHNMTTHMYTSTPRLPSKFYSSHTCSFWKLRVLHTHYC
jgi:hypothetical protein